MQWILVVAVLIAAAIGVKRILTQKNGEIKKLQKNNEELTKKVDRLAGNLQKTIEINDKFAKENAELQKRLQFYTEIDADAGKFNDTAEQRETEKLLDEVGEELKAVPSDDKIGENESRTHGDAPEINSRILDPEQESALSHMLYTNENLFITGKAGTGKSFLLKAFVRETNKKILVLAPTGIAALNVNGITIHRAFGYKSLTSQDVEYITEKTLAVDSTKQRVLENVETIIIDEISMVRADVMDKIDRILRIINKSNAYFGGKQMILFGDPFQLPPVVKWDEGKYLKEKYGGIHFFCSNAYQNGNFHFIELTINHRQKEDFGFFEVLNRIREGTVTVDDLALLNNRKINPEDVGRYVTLFPKKNEAEEMNREKIDDIEGKEYIYFADVVLNKRKDQRYNLESSFPITKELKLKVGALVMMVANDPELRWVNGSMGVVKKLKENAVFVSFGSDTYEVKKVKFTESEAIYIDGKIYYDEILAVEQFPVVLAYAITIHKSQGATYKEIACDLDQCFAPGQAYVALSRCESLNGLHVLSNVTMSALQVDRQIREFYQKQKELFS